MYSNCCCSSSFEAEIIKIGQSSHKMYSNKILNLQNAFTKNFGNLLKAPRTSHQTSQAFYCFLSFHVQLEQHLHILSVRTRLCIVVVLLFVYCVCIEYVYMKGKISFRLFSVTI